MSDAGGFHRRRLAEELKDEEFRTEYERARTEIAQVDSIIRQLDELRVEAGWPKAELARRIGKDPASVRRLFSAEVNPELKTIVAMASALGAKIEVVAPAKRKRRQTRGPRRTPDVA